MAVGAEEGGEGLWLLADRDGDEGGPGLWWLLGSTTYTLRQAGRVHVASMDSLNRQTHRAHR